MEQFIPLSVVQERHTVQEKCGITAWVSKTGQSVASESREMQHRVNHRGEDNAGFVTIGEDSLLNIISRPGRVKTAFPTALDLPQGDRIIGHNRYATSEDPRFYQPVVARVDGHWIALAHNGNIPDEYRADLRQRIPDKYADDLTFDSAELAYAILTAKGKTWKDKIKNGLKDIPMAYALTILTDTGDVYGIVGPSGHWPLWLGENDEGLGLASETRAFPEGTKTRAIKPGELVHITPKGATVEKLFPDLLRYFRCALHEVYGAKPDSRRDNGELYSDMRKRLGSAVARDQEGQAIRGEDVLYIGVPTSGQLLAEGYVETFGSKLTDIITLSKNHKKNGTNGRERSFLAVTPEEMELVVAGKFSLRLTELIKGRKLVIIDDSVIRGNTIRQVIAKLREFDPKELHIISGLTEVMRSCENGYNIIQAQGLIALKGNGKSNEHRTINEIAEELDVDSIYYPSVGVLKEVLGEDICTECLLGGEKVRLRRAS